LSLLTLGLGKDLSSPSSSSRLSSVAARNRFAEAIGYGVAVIGMEDQWLAAALAVGEAFCAAVPLPQAGPADEISGDLGLFPLDRVDLRIDYWMPV
jgi:hypothetical protein